MSTFYDSGAGSPTSWVDGPSSPAADPGAGEPLGYDDFPGEPDVLALGAGDPWIFGDLVIVPDPGEGEGVSPSKRWSLANLKRWLSWEGGYVMKVGTASELPEGSSYRVDMVDITGQTHPVLESGCYSTVQGQGTTIYPEPDRKTLIFGTPPLQQGVYKIKITNNLNQTNTLADDYLVVMSPDSFEVNSIRAGMPWKVYSGAHPDKEYPDG